MDFELTSDQREIQALTHEFAAAEIEPHAAAWDRDHRFPQELFGKLAELGLMGACIPEEYGGAGTDFLSYILVLEELSRADAGVGVTVAVHTSAVTLPILTFGSEEQRARFVPPLARGEAIGSFALTEAESGSDAGSLRTAAVPEGAGWRITGSKQWITNGTYAGTFLLFARTDADTPGARGVSAFVLDADHVRVTREYAKERHTFGKRIADHQAVQFKLADMSTEIDAARMLVYRAAWLKQHGRAHTEEGAKAKLFASEVARRQTAEAIQVLGGYGYTKEFAAERYYRDAKVTEIYEGTSEIQRLVIARAILGLAHRAMAVPQS